MGSRVNHNSAGRFPLGAGQFSSTNDPVLFWACPAPEARHYRVAWNASRAM